MTVVPLSLPEISLVPDQSAQGSPQWWARRLHQELVNRQPDIQLLRRYAGGDHNPPLLPEKASRAFRRIMGLSPTNLCGLVIEATAERMAVQGFRFGDSEDADEDAWRIWQGSDFDAESDLLITDALTVGRSFVMVEPAQGGSRWPRLYAEDAEQVVVAYAPGRRTDRAAGWKEWQDDWTGDTHATLYLPDRLVKLRASRPPGALPSNSQSALRWDFRDARVESEPNPLGEVPIWEIQNRPQLQPGIVKSEIADVMTDQDACNHIAMNALIAMEYGAFRQKWVTGITVGKDPVTGDKVEPFDVAVDRIIGSTNAAARFGDFEATDLRPYIELYESRVKHMAAVTRTPAPMILGGMVNIAAEALALSVAGLVQKVKRKQHFVEQSFEAAMRAAFRLAGDPRADADAAETIWVDPEVRSAAQQADAAAKLVGAGVIASETAQEVYLGLSPMQRTRDRSWREEADALSQFTATLNRQTTVTSDQTVPVVDDAAVG